MLKTLNDSETDPTIIPRYCFNSIVSVDWNQSSYYAEDNSFVDVKNDELAYNGDCYGFVEQTLLPDPVGPKPYKLGTEKKDLFVKVTLQHPIPQGLRGTVHLDWFDPINILNIDNISVINGRNDKNGKRDNHGEMRFTSNGEPQSTPVVLSFENGTKINYSSAEITKGYAGDNYKIVAHPNAGVIERVSFDNNDVL